MNHITIIGRLVRDPELRYTNSGKAFVTFTLAVDRRKDKDGNKQADFIPCMAWDKLAEIIARLRSMSPLYEDFVNRASNVQNI